MLKNAVWSLFLIVLPFIAPAQDPPTKPTFNAKDLNDRAIKLEDYRGKVVLLNFWATWCAPCRAEVPDLIKLQSDYGKAGLQIIGINFPPEEADIVRKFAQTYKINYPLVVGNGDIAPNFDAASGELPTTVIIDREGRVRDHVEGILKPDVFAQKVKPLLAATKK